jgi:predicted nucleic acid-binding protein
MALPTLTLDTNVLVAAFRSSLGASYRLMELVGEGAFEIGITAALVLEYESVCKRLEGVAWVTAQDVDALVDYLCRVGKRSVVHFHTRPAVPDPDDELVLEAAIASGSDWIVTHNLRDLVAASARFGIEAITPAEALRRLGARR